MTTMAPRSKRRKHAPQTALMLRHQDNRAAMLCGWVTCAIPGQRKHGSFSCALYRLAYAAKQVKDGIAAAVNAWLQERE